MDRSVTPMVEGWLERVWQRLKGRATPLPPYDRYQAALINLEVLETTRSEIQHRIM